MAKTIKDAYNQAAKVYRMKYDVIGPRTEDVDSVFSYIDKVNPKVLEIGCAYGREAEYILTKTNQYVGVDICDEYIDMARNEVAEGDFVCADIIDYEFPKNIDIIFAFASLLHLPRENMLNVLNNASASLVSGGVAFLSLKRRDTYYYEEVTDVVPRTFYYYNRSTIEEILPQELKIVDYQEQHLKEGWFTVILQKSQ